MTDEQALAIYNRMVEKYGDNLPNPDHCPKTFEYLVRLMKYYEPEIFRAV
jgi:hypothetical protein